MIKPVMLDHIVLRTQHYQALITFYNKVLGCSIERDVKDIGLTQLRAGNSLIDIVDVNGELGRAGGGAPQSTGNNVDHFCLQIEPCDEEQLKLYLKEQGVEVGDFKERYGAQGMGRSLY